MHCEDPELTVVVVFDDQEKLVRDAIQIFKDSIEIKYPETDTKNAEITVKNAKGKAIDQSGKVKAVVSHMDDLYVTVKKGEKASIKTARKSVDEKSPGKRKHSAEKVKETESDNPEDEGRVNAAMIHSANGRVRKAISMCKEILKENKYSKKALKGLVSCYGKAGRHKIALKYAKQGLEINEENPEFLMLVGEAYLNMGDGETALEYLKKGIKHARSSGGKSTEEKLDIQVLLAKAYLLQDQKSMAINILQGVLRENLDHEEALTEYADLIFPLGPKQSQEAVSIILTVLARRQNDKSAQQVLAAMKKAPSSDKRAKEVFASIMKDPQGLPVLKFVASSAMKDSDALVFLGSCLRDNSVIDMALELFKMASERSPGNPSVALIHLHTLELLDSNKQMLDFVQKYLTSFPEKKIGTLTLSSFYVLLGEILKHYDLRNAPSVDTASDEVNFIAKSPQPYTDDDRYLLAFLFTIVKILYVKGLVAQLPDMLSLLEVLYKGKELHESNIKNEAAYFNCIYELFRIEPTIPATQPNKSQEILYFIGDSHCIPAAWKTLNIQVKIMIVPH